MQMMRRDLARTQCYIIYEAIIAFIKRVMPSVKRQDNPTTAIVIIVLAILSSVAFGEDLKFCKGEKVINKHQLSNLTDCDVIEGHLILAFEIFNSTQEWQDFGSLKVREITDFLVIFMVDNLRSLNTLLPNLTVIRGHRLYMSYALIVYANKHLEEIKLKNLTALMNGSVFIKHNKMLNGYVNTVDWNSIIYWNREHCTHPNIIQISNDTRNCSESCSIGDKALDNSSGNRNGFCWSADDCQKKCQFGSTCTSAGEPCHDQCAGGCFAPRNDRECIACNGFRDRKGNKCYSSCDALYELNDYVCVTDVECGKLGRKKQELVVNTTEGFTVRKLCVEECFSGYQEDPNSSLICMNCTEGGCAKRCKGGLIDSISKAQEYEGCRLIDGNLEIILFEANLTAELPKYLGNIEVVSGYVRVFKSIALPSLQFFKNLRSIEGSKLWLNTYSLIVNDNDELQELWHNEYLTLQKGEALFYANPKLCPQDIEKLLKNKWREHFPALNGNKKACFVNDKLNLLLTPLDTGKGVIKVQIPEVQLDGAYLNRIAGFYVFYKLNISENNRIKEDKLRLGPSSSSIPSAWSVHLQRYSITKDSKYLETVINGLQPAQNYNFYIETVMVNNDDNIRGFQSKVFQVATLPYYPSEPVNVTYSGSKNCIEVRWKPPLEPNGEIHQYELSVVPYEVQMKKVNLCTKTDSDSNSGDNQNLNKESTDRGTESTDIPLPSSSICSTVAQNPAEKIATERKITDDLENFLNMDISMSSSTFGRAKRDVSWIDYLQDQMATKSRIRKRSAGWKMERNNLAMTQPKSLQDLVNASLKREWGPFYKNLNLSFENICSLLHQIYENDRSIPVSPEYLQTCLKMEDTTEPSIDDRNTIYENFIKRRKRSIPERKKVAITNLVSIVVAENYGGTYKMTNLKANSSYLLKIRACHKPINGARLCNGICKCSNETYIVVHALHDDQDVRVQNIAVEKGKGDNIIVKWLPPKFHLGLNLAYIIEVKGPGFSRSFCEASLNKSLHLLASGNYDINVTAFSDNWSKNFSTPTEIHYSFDNAAIISEFTERRNVSIIYVVTFFVAFILLLAVVLLFRKGKKPEIPLSNFIENPGYIIMHPTMKEYLYDKIPVEKLYSKKDFKRTGVAGQGKFGIVNKGALNVMDGTNKNKYILVAAKQLINPIFIDLEHKKHFRVNDLRNQDRYNEPKNKNGEYEPSNQDNELITPKQINNQDIELTKQLIDEASLMLTLKSFHLVRTLGVMCENYELSIIMELMTTDNLSSYMKKHRKWGSTSNLFPLEQVMKFGVQIADGMAYLAEKRVVHRDLAARNCLLDCHFNVKVSDFGMARVLQNDIYISTGENKPVPVRWMPPEYFKEEKFVINSDVYSYGILLWEIVNPGEIPYKEVKIDSQVQEKVLGGVTLIPSIPRWVPSQLRVLMGRCWHYMPEDRPCFRDIVLHLLKYTSNNFKEDFKKASFFYCGDTAEFEPEDNYYPIPSVKDDDVGPSTPLTSPTAENAFSDINTSVYVPHDSPRRFINSILTPFNMFINVWNKPRNRHGYSLDFSQLPFSFSTRELRNNKHSSVNLPSSKPDVLPVNSRTLPADQHAIRQMDFA